METASLLLRTMLVLSGGFAAGVVLGAQVPIVLPTRHDAMEVRIAACVLAMLQATHAQLSPRPQRPAAMPHAPATTPTHIAAS
jgi:hypothetical protein